jgi:uncharacterized protein (TIGR00725 family)
MRSGVGLLPREVLAMLPGEELQGLALRLLARQSGQSACRQPVSVVGPREASALQLACAVSIGRMLGALRVPVLCGGKNGVMAAVSEGVSASGGIVVGLLPEEDTSLANPHLTVAVPTGLGITRNALIARAARAMVAIGGGLGTTSEMALALQWGKPVFAIHGAPDVPGHRRFEDEASLVGALMGELMSEGRG